MTCDIRRAAAWLPVIGVPVLPAVTTVIALRVKPWPVAASPIAVLGFVWAHCLRYTFRDTLNLVQGIGPAYYIVRDKEDTSWGLSRGFMRETDFPWRRGQGIQLDVPKRSLQIGLCRRRAVASEEDGLLDVLDGHMMETDVEEISQW